MIFYPCLPLVVASQFPAGPIDCEVLSQKNYGCDFDHCLEAGAECGCRGRFVVDYHVRRESCGGMPCEYAVAMEGEFFEGFDDIDCPPGEHCFVTISDGPPCPIYGTSIIFVSWQVA